MLNIMEKMKESERSGKGDSEISLMPMNLSTMLNNTRSRDTGGVSGLSLSSLQHLGSHHPGLLNHPGGLGGGGLGERRPQHSDSSMSPNGGDVDMEEEEGVDVDDEGGNNSSKDRARHPSAEIRAQFMADLRRLGGNIPTSSSSHSRGGGAPDHPDSSVGSPPPPAPATPSSGPTPTKQPSEDTSSGSANSSSSSLPPRKRKVSQEHHNLSSSSETTTEKFNGTHEKGANGPEDLTPAGKEEGETSVTKEGSKDAPVEVSN